MFFLGAEFILAKTIIIKVITARFRVVILILIAKILSFSLFSQNLFTLLIFYISFLIFMSPKKVKDYIAKVLLMLFAKSHF